MMIIRKAAAKILYVSMSSLAMLGLIIAILPLQSQALSGSSFNAGRIIDDYVFYKYDSMSAASIQKFLNSQVPVCDTNHAKSSSANDPGPPYTCLKTYSVRVPGRSADAYCPGSVTSSGTTKRTAAEIIYEVAQACHVSPKVLLVTLQKESALVTDTWPWPYQYSAAMGYGCPDSSGCDSTYAGLFKQLYYAARQFQNYAHNPNSFNYVAGTNNQIQWSPKSSCGSSTVYISTQATAGLYNYTPYRPNTAALNNLYGTGDSCSAYGNRNFWRDYNDWFGSTLANPIRATVVDAHSNESGGAAAVEFSLVSQPSGGASVTIPLSLSSAAEASFSNSTSLTSENLVITAANWNKPSANVATIYGRNDGAADGDVGYTLKTGDPSSTDSTYGSLIASDIPDVGGLINDSTDSDTTLTGNWTGTKQAGIGLKRGNEYFLNVAQKTSVDFHYGTWTDTSLVGAWQGGLKSEVGLKRGNEYFLSNNHKTIADFHYGRSGDTPLVGKWDGSGKDEIAIRRGNQYFLSNNAKTIASFIYGKSSDTVLIGDWDGSGKDEIGLKRGNEYFLSNNHKTIADFTYGQSTDTALVGSWDGSGKDEIGLKRGNEYFLSNNHKTIADFTYGQSTDTALVGSWDGSGKDEIGLKRGNEYFLSNNHKTIASFNYGR